VANDGTYVVVFINGAGRSVVKNGFVDAATAAAYASFLNGGQQPS
jgi:hypothetical protein